MGTVFLSAESESRRGQSLSRLRFRSSEGDTLLPKPIQIAPQRKPLTSALNPLSPSSTEKGTVFITAAVAQFRKGHCSSAEPSQTRWGRSSCLPNQNREGDSLYPDCGSAVQKGTLFFRRAVANEMGTVLFEPNQNREGDRVFSAALLAEAKLIRMGAEVVWGDAANGCRTRIRKGTVFSGTNC